MVATFEPKKTYKVIGTRPIRHDGYDKVTGRALYGADLKLPGQVWGAVLRSPYAHANITRMDTSEAEKYPGVLAVVTAKDMPKAESKMVDLGEGTVNEKHEVDRIMASDKIVFRGQPVAAVAAVDRNTAEEAVKLIRVEYQPLQPVLTVEEAMAKGAPIILPDLVGDDLGEKVKKTNMAKHFRHEFGDVEKGFSQAKHIVERTFKMSMTHQGYIEPHNAVAMWDEDNRLRIWTGTQGAFAVRKQMAGILKLDESRVKVTPMEIGGGFGGKIPVYLEPIAALLSKKCRRPVKLVMERKAVFESTGPAPGGTLRVKVGVDASGKITAAASDMKLEAGGFPGSAVGAAAMCIYSPYNIPNTTIDGWDIVVNKPKSAPYRAPGAPQAHFAMESVIDELCEKGGWDPIDFRLKNSAKEGTRRGDGVKFGSIGNVDVLKAASRSPHWKSVLNKDTTDGKKRGRGIASGYWFNIGLKSAVTLSANNDGTVSLVEGSTDIGGSRASIAMQAAEVLGIPALDVRPTVADTEGVAYNDVTGGSRTTYATGFAAYEAAIKMVEELKARAARIWNQDPSDILFKDGVFSAKKDSELRLNFKELSKKLGETGGPVTVTGSVDLSTGGGAYGAHIVDVEVDTETGKVEILRYTIVQDVGKAIHPSYVEGQMQGGVVQGIGWALNEEYFMTKEGTMANSSFLDYRMPTTLDLPKIETVIVEVFNPGHPFGVRGVGEVPIAPPIAAIGNALHDALGVRLVETPFKPGRIMEALEAQSKAAAVKPKR
ncbi:MAG: xanthine dehydrogenase family protein molybdopterin-binding subunit [Dehalococcoidia bacterium]|nr:xanthine dehydrogenase family protein molybdopterin-binding subunit [Dehalococcoidia bacterium]MSQ34687.1 xanthine dehydrogenase family protein molybdopterin-binding subunit [Dehalococcoidia bacterium]